MGWRTKFVFLLIVYCAGFATAIYCLAPAPDDKSSPSLRLSQISAAVQPEGLLKSFNSGMHKCLGFSKEAAQEAAKLLQAKIDEALKARAKEDNG